MKKFLLLVVAFLFLGIGAQAQTTMSKGQLVGSAKVGFSDYGLPLGIALDYGVASGFINGKGAVSVGGELGLYLSEEYTHLSIAARGNFHYEFVQNLIPLLNEGGILFADNVLFRGYVDGKVKTPKRFNTTKHSMENFIKGIMENPDLKGQVIDIEDGISITEKIE
jgi:hypothetical protein